MEYSGDVIEIILTKKDIRRIFRAVLVGNMASYALIKFIKFNLTK